MGQSFQTWASSTVGRHFKMSEKKKTGINMPLDISPELAKIIGTKKGEQMSRGEVVKKLWAYLKEHNLQDPDQKQFFTPNKDMEGIFGNERTRCFSMSKYLKDHLTNPNK